MNIFKKLFGIDKLEAEVNRLSAENSKLVSENRELNDKLEVVSYGLFHEQTYFEALWKHESDTNLEFASKHLSKEQYNEWLRRTNNQKAVEKWSEELHKKYGDDTVRLNRKYREMLGEKF